MYFYYIIVNGGNYFEKKNKIIIKSCLNHSTALQNHVISGLYSLLNNKIKIIIKILEGKTICICAVMYTVDTCGELKSRLLGDVVVWMVNYYF
jgi:hypothetical protein